QRLKNLDRFKGYKLSNSNTGIALVVTDVVARGIDIENVTHVVHYQIPQSVDLYIHRSGRTARAGNEGFSLMIVCPSELKMLTSIRDALDQSVNTNNSSIVKKRKESVVKNFPEDLSFFPEIRERVTLAKKIVISERNIESLKDRKISFKDGDENSGQKSIERNDTYDDNEDSDSIGEQMQKEDEQMIKNKRQVKIQEQSQMLRKQLDAISQKPLIPKGVSVRYPTSNPKRNEDISNVNIDSEKDSEESRSDVDSERDIKLKNIKQNTNESSVGSESDDDDESESEISDGEISIFNGVKLPLGLDPKILAFFPFTDAPVIVNLSNIQTNQFSSSKSSSSISNQQLEKVVPTVSATPSTLVHRYVTCAVGDKDTHLVYFLSRFRGRALIFVNTIDLIRFLVPMLRSLNIPTYGLHSQMQQRQRLKNLDRFKGYKLSNSNTGIALVVTDVVARGIDIENVTHVV
ncbi:MAG: putative ATP-dependent RNA helicase MAK5, partial [Streblomastix strix]